MRFANLTDPTLIDRMYKAHCAEQAKALRRFIRHRQDQGIAITKELMDHLADLEAKAKAEPKPRWYRRIFK